MSYREIDHLSTNPTNCREFDDYPGHFTESIRIIVKNVTLSAPVLADRVPPEACSGWITDTNRVFIDAALGYWLYQSNDPRGLSGVIPTVEIHQTSSTQDSGAVSAGPFQVGSFNGNTSITSFVAGTTFEFGQETQLTAGYVVPLGGGSDRQFDGAFQFQVNRIFGPSR